jgi:hypothetical protein
MGAADLQRVGWLLATTHAIKRCLLCAPVVVLLHGWLLQQCNCSLQQ